MLAYCAIGDNVFAEQCTDTTISEMLKRNYCSADKIATDDRCYKWAKTSGPNISLNYFCQQQHMDPLCTGVQIERLENPFKMWFILIFIIAIMLVAAVVWVSRSDTQLS